MGNARAEFPVTRAVGIETVRYLEENCSECRDHCRRGNQNAWSAGGGHATILMGCLRGRERYDMKAWLVLAMALALAGCRVDRAPMDAAHVQRVETIDRDFDREIAENDRRWDDLKKQVLDQRQYLIEVEPGTDSKPKTLVAMQFLDSFNACQGTPDAPAPEAVRVSCEGVVRESFYRALGGRYFKADFDWVFRQRQADPDLDLELLATKSHNEVLQAEIKKSLAEIVEHKADFRRTMQGYRDDRVQLSAQQRDNEVENADRKRRAVWAAALQGFAQGMQNASQTSAATSYAPPTAYGGSGGCTSDFSCGVGKKCVKQYYNSTGVCMQAVNEYGSPSYELPALDSVGPNMPSKASCSIGTSCPIGFRCDLGSGVCVK
jgi:hypothetical protein